MQPRPVKDVASGTSVGVQNNVDEWVLALTRSGLRLTEPRQTILRAIVGRDAPFTAEELVDQLKDRGIGRATVFRTLELLGDMNILHRVHGAGRAAYTACPPEHHHHLVCSLCGRSINVELCGLEEQMRRLARDTDFTIDEHHLEFTGRCGACRRTSG
jgi:Fur family ferric uptake transcriptional regulator